MSDEFLLHAQARTDAGKGASRRLRRLQDLVPAIVYGGKQPPQPISISHKDFNRALENEAFYSHIVSLNIDGTAEDVIIKDLQRNPAKPRILHADFFRIEKNKKITVNVPLHFINEEKCVGVKLHGGIISHNETEIEISCLPADLPEFVEVDMAAVDIGENIHLSDLTLPAGTESVALSHGDEQDLFVAAVAAPKAVVEEEVEEAEDAEDTPDDAAEDAADEDES
ncbi:MAG: 50S ribosomal protein L25/general stress protein Ctc [Pseudomonadales bacterium]